MIVRAPILVTAMLVLGFPIKTANAQARICPVGADFNCYMTKAAHTVVADYGNKGFSYSPYMTHDFDYADSGLKIRANPNVSTLPSRQRTDTSLSCNGAILQIFFTAINLYQKDNKSWKATDYVPINAWNSLKLNQLRAHISMFNIREMPPFKEMIASGKKIDPELKKAIDRYDVRSVAHAFEKFGLGDVVKMEDLKAGDVVTFDRRMHKIVYPKGFERIKDGKQSEPIDKNIAWGSTHSVVFLNWVDENQKETGNPSNAKGFRYVSSQSNDDATGLGYKWAYFNGFCPQDPKNTVRTSETAPGQKNGHKTYCNDQRKQDIAGYSPAMTSFPKQLLHHKSDCCLFRKDAAWQRGDDGLIAGRIKIPTEWKIYAEKQKEAAEELEDLEERAKQTRPETH